MRAIAFAFMSIAFMECSFAATPSAKSVLEKEIGSSLATMNNSGHPIFLSSCQSKDANTLVLVIASNGTSGLQIALNKDGVITSLSEVTPAPKGSGFLVEADGGESSQANANRIFKVLKLRPFHLLEKIALDDISNPTDKSSCDIAIGIN